MEPASDKKFKEAHADEREDLDSTEINKQQDKSKSELLPPINPQQDVVKKELGDSSKSGVELQQINVQVAAKSSNAAQQLINTGEESPDKLLREENKNQPVEEFKGN